MSIAAAASSNPTPNFVSISISIPCARNFYNVYFNKNEINALSTIRSYPPSDDNNFITECQKIFRQSCNQETTRETGAIFHQHADAFNRMLIQIDLNSLVNFSEVSKCCYLAAKADRLWNVQFQKLFPHIQPMTTSRYSSEQQFKAYFIHFNCTLKLYKEKFKKNSDALNELNIDIIKAHSKFEAYGGQEAYTRFLRAQCASTLNETRIAAGIKVHYALANFARLMHERCILVGDTYNGTIQSVSPNSQLKRCLDAINILIPRSFNNQKQFEEYIKKSEQLFLS